MTWRGLFRTLSLPGCLFLATGLYLAFEAVFASVGLMLVQAMLGVSDAAELQRLLFRATDAELADPALRFAIQLVNILAGVGKLLAGLAFLGLVQGHPLSRPGTDRAPRWLPALLAVAAVLVAGPAIDGLHAANRALLAGVEGGWIEQMRDWEARAGRLTRALTAPGDPLPMATTFLMVALLAPAWEELIFRGIGQRLAEAWTRNGHAAVWIAAAVFAAVHFQFLSFIPRMALALVLGYAYLYTRNLWVPILAHFANNGSYLAYAWITGAAPEPGSPAVWLAAGSGALAAALLVVLHRLRDRGTPPPWAGLPLRANAGSGPSRGSADRTAEADPPRADPPD